MLVSRGRCGGRSARSTSQLARFSRRERPGHGEPSPAAAAKQASGDDQVTLNGHLLYYYASDSAPGATSGQGVGGKWFVVSPAGEAVTSAPSGKLPGY